MERNVTILTTTILEYLQRNSLFVQNPPWEIKTSELGGFGLFATRNIEVGEVIFKDFPVILGPRSASTCPSTCVGCYSRKNLKFCERQCGLQVCSTKCQNANNHQRECKVIRGWKTQEIPEEHLEKLGKVLAPIRSLLLSDDDKNVMRLLKVHQSHQQSCEVDALKTLLHLNIKEDEENFMRLACSVLDTNAFEVVIGTQDNQSSIKAVYPLGSLANHSCAPNTFHVFDQNKDMVVRASKFIPQNSEIFHSYTGCTWGTPARRFHLLQTKHFLCGCPRCQDPTEFGSYMSAILCKVCKGGKVIPSDHKEWRCENCGKATPKKEVAELTSLLRSTVNSFADDNIEIMLRFIQKKLPTMVPKNNETVVQLKYKLIWILGHCQNATWPELSDELLFTKEQFCKDLLTLLATLNLGQSRMRGLLLYELFCCSNEIVRRQTKAGIVSKVCSKNKLTHWAKFQIKLRQRK